MSQQCPRCRGNRFTAAAVEGAETLALVLEDGTRCRLEALLCRDCGRVEFVATRARAGTQPKSDDDVQQYDF